jgi:hypothetical protein
MGGSGGGAMITPTAGRLAAGNGFTCALDQAGGVSCFGDLRGLSANVASADFKFISASISHICAVANSGGITCWTNGTTDGEIDDNVPAGSFDVVEVGGGDLEEFACAWKTGQPPVCWRDADRPPLANQRKPPAGQVFTALALAEHHGCGLTGADGAIACWGPNTLDVIKAVPAGRHSAVSSGRFFSCALQADTGRPFCWGLNDYFGDHFKKLSFASLASSADERITCAVRKDGRVYCGTTSGAYQEPQDKALRFREVAVGRQHACGATVDDRVSCWTALTGGAAAKLTTVPAELRLMTR